MRRLVPALLMLAPAMAPAGPFDQPWAVVAGDTAPSADPKLRPATVSRVDGESTVRGRAVVAPGARMVTVDLPPRKGSSLGTQETFELQASPCMRYHIAARLEAGAEPRWQPVVRSSETIGECLAKFKGGATPK